MTVEDEDEREAHTGQLERVEKDFMGREVHISDAEPPADAVECKGPRPSLERAT
jgi:hypothetical protein